MTSRKRKIPGVDQLPSGKWRVRYTDPQGRTRSLGTYDAFEDAKAARARVDTAVAGGTYRAPEQGAETLAQYIDRWLERNQPPRLGTGTHQRYADSARIYIVPEQPRPSGRGRGIELGMYPLRALTYTLIDDWFAQVQAHAAARVRAKAIATAQRRTPTDTQAARTWAQAAGMNVPSSGRLSPDLLAAWRAAKAPKPKVAPVIPDDPGATAAARAYSLLRTVLNDALREDLIALNPCMVRGAGTVEHDERVPATLEEVAIMTAAMPERYAATVPVAMWAALRIGEMAALRRADVTIARADGQITGGTLRVERSAGRVKGQGTVFGPTKTKGSKRTVHLPRVAAVALAAHMEKFTGPRGDSLVFTNTKGSPLTDGHFYTVWSRARAAAGRPDLHFHDLRHTGMTLAAKTGATIKDLQARAGHRTTRAALLYQHAASEADAEIAKKLDAIAG